MRFLVFFLVLKSSNLGFHTTEISMTPAAFQVLSRGMWQKLLCRHSEGIKWKHSQATQKRPAALLSWAELCPAPSPYADSLNPSTSKCDYI